MKKNESEKNIVELGKAFTWMLFISLPGLVFILFFASNFISNGIWLILFFVFLFYPFSVVLFSNELKRQGVL